MAQRQKKNQKWKEGKMNERKRANKNRKTEKM